MTQTDAAYIAAINSFFPRPKHLAFHKLSRHPALDALFFENIFIGSIVKMEIGMSKVPDYNVSFWNSCSMIRISMKYSNF